MKKIISIFALILLIFSCEKDTPKIQDDSITIDNLSFKTTPFSEHIVSIDFIDTLNGFGIGSNLIHKTIDGGKNWELVFTGETGLEILAVDMYDSNNVYSIARILNNNPDIPSNFTYYLITSNTGGETFEIHEIPIGYDAYKDVTNISCLSADKIFLSGMGTLIKTLDGGNNFEEVQLTGNKQWLKKVYFDEFGNAYCGREDGSIMISVDSGDTWKMKDTSIEDQIYKIYIKGDIVYFRTLIRLYFTDSNFETVKKYENYGADQQNLLHFYNEKVLLNIGYRWEELGAFPYAFISISNDGGITWNNVPNLDPKLSGYVAGYIRPISVDDKNIMAISNNREYPILVHIKINDNE